MDEQIAIDRILENENLTDGLDDDEADWLLNWGTTQVKKLIVGVEDEQAGEKVNKLMSVMQDLNKLVANRTVKTPERLAEDVKVFISDYDAAFDQSRAMGVDEAQQISGEIVSLSASEALQHLIAVVEPHD